MKKIWLSILMLVMLCGCKVNAADFDRRLDDSIQDALHTQLNAVKYNKHFYSYYIEPSIGRIDADETGNYFNYDGTKFLMTLNIDNIVNEKYYTDRIHTASTTNDSKLVVERDGSYVDLDDKEHSYVLKIYDFDGFYHTYLHTTRLDFYGVTDQVKAANLAGLMLQIARNTKIKTDAITAKYSVKESIEFESQKLQLFEYVAPESGFIDDLFSDTTNTAGEMMDDDGNEQPAENYHTHIETDEIEGE